MYHFGYYYHFPSIVQKYKQVVLLMQNGMFMFNEVASDLIPLNKRSMTSAYYDLSMPIICSLNGNTVSEVVCLYDVPISKGNNEGGFSFEINIDNRSTILKYDNKPFIDDNIIDKKDLKFAHLIEEYVGANKRIMTLNQIISFITPDKHRRSKEIITRDLMRIVDSYNLEDILTSLSVVVTDFYRSKVGGDDSYRIDRTACLEDKSVKTDEYIEKVIGLGTECIHSDSGYTSNLRAYAPKVYIGEYKGEELENEKKRILSNYSKAEHLSYIFFTKLEEKERALVEIDSWKNDKEEIKEKLNSDFFIDTLSHIDERFFYGNYNVALSDLLGNVNSLIRRIMLKYPRKRIVISGALPFVTNYSWSRETDKTTRKRLVSKITNILEQLLNTYNVEIITGNADGAEQFALQYALNNKVEIVNNYTSWTMLGKDRKMERYYEMVKIADIVYLTNYNDSYLYNNFLKVANERNVPVEIIEDEVE